MPYSHPTDTTKASLLPIFAILGAVILWGGSFPATKFVLQYLDTAPLMWARTFVALMVMLPLMRRVRPQRITKKDLPLLLGMVICEPCLYFLCETRALQLTTSSQAGVISASLPLMLAFGGWLILKEKVSRFLWIGVAISCTGVAALTLVSSAPTEAAPNPVLGNMLEIAAMACAAGSTICVSKLVHRKEAPWNPVMLTIMQCGSGFLFFSTGAMEVITEFHTWPIALIGSVLYLGIGASLIAFILYHWSLSRLPASHVGCFINLIPVAAIFFGWLTLGEELSFAQAMAVLVIMAGVTLGSRK
ncbi:MAG: DMT family transporter [Pseudomonadota bacterium]